MNHELARVNISSARATNLTKIFIYHSKPSPIYAPSRSQVTAPNPFPSTPKAPSPCQTCCAPEGQSARHEARLGGGGAAGGGGGGHVGGSGVGAGGGYVVHGDADHDVHSVPQLRDGEHQRRRVADAGVLRLAGGDGAHGRRLRLPHPHRERALQPPHQPHARHLPPQALQLHVRPAAMQRFVAADSSHIHTSCCA